MKDPEFILSTCGTALLTNPLNQQERQRVNRYSNTKNVDEIPREDREWLEALLDQRRGELLAADLAGVARFSAELNGLIRYYGGVIEHNRDYHLLLCTDTWLGEQVGEIEADWLRRFCSIVEVKRERDLQTAELEPFQLALSDLAKWSEETLPGYRQAGYRIVFNLTGGFKSVQGFLQTLATFYADEVVYVFQEANSLMRIPRLPIQLTAHDTVREHLEVFRRLALGLAVSNEECSGVPETLLMSYCRQLAFSPWGSLVWEQSRKQVYGERLWPSPSPRIRFGPKFEVSLRGLATDRLRMVNEKIDDLAHYLETGQDVRSLDFKKLQGNPQPPSTHEMDAWSDQDARRIYGQFESEVFVLDKLDGALH
jgi:putative CRISPR-associated protein (TIGR02619 family)